MPFYGGLSLGGGSGGTAPQGYDQFVQQLLAQFPGLSQLQSGTGAPQTTGSLGFSFPGQNLYSGQPASGGGLYGSTGTGIFEGAAQGQPESVTGGLAQGFLGKSPSQTPLSNTGQPGTEPPLGTQNPAGLSGTPSPFDQPVVPTTLGQPGSQEDLLGAPPQRYDLIGPIRAVIGGINLLPRPGQPTGPPLTSPPDTGPPVPSPDLPASPVPGIPTGFGGPEVTTLPFPGIPTGFGGPDLANPSFGELDNAMAFAPFGTNAQQDSLLKTILGTVGLGQYADQIGQGLGGLGGLFGLYQGIQQGNPVAATVGGLQAANSLSGLLGGPALAGMYAGPASAAIAAAMAGWTEAQQFAARNSGWWNNPIKGQLYAQATADIASTNELLDQLHQIGLDKVPTPLLQQLVAPIANGLASYFATAQGGRGAIRASDTVTGGGGPAGNQPYTGDGASPGQYTDNFTRAREGLVGLVQHLLQRGVTFEQLGQAPVTGDFVQQSMDMGNPLIEYYNRGNQGPNAFDTQAQGFLSQMGSQRPTMAWQSTGEGGYEAPTGQMENWVEGPNGPQPIPPGAMTPQLLLQAAQGGAPYSSAANSGASGYITDMYGGPLWAAMARMGAGGQPIQDLIQQHFDPWVHVRPDPATWGNALLTYAPAMAPWALAGGVPESPSG